MHLGKPKMVEMPDLKILITDTSSLITLAVADSLDYLALLGIPIFVPDAVYFEATADIEKLGASDIVVWVQQNPSLIQIIPTDTFIDEMHRRENGERKRRDLGETAALEIANNSKLIGHSGQSFILTEDDAVLDGGFMGSNNKRQIYVISTHDFLDVLEAEQLINSAEAIYVIAEDAGRLASKRKADLEKEKTAVAAIQELIHLQSERDKK
jgi:hypothetical protein